MRTSAENNPLPRFITLFPEGLAQYARGTSLSGAFGQITLTPSPMHFNIKTGSIIKLQKPPRGIRKMTILQKARRGLYTAMDTGRIEEILEASRKLDELIVHQMERQYGKKKAQVA